MAPVEKDEKTKNHNFDLIGIFSALLFMTLLALAVLRVAVPAELSLQKLFYSESQKAGLYSQ